MSSEQAWVWQRCAEQAMETTNHNGKLYAKAHRENTALRTLLSQVEEALDDGLTYCVFEDAVTRNKMRAALDAVRSISNGTST